MCEIEDMKRNGFLMEEMEEIESEDLFLEVLGSVDLNSSKDMFNINSYLIDMREYLNRNPILDVDCDLEDFTQESLASISDMSWLNFVTCHLLAPNSPDIEEQKKQLLEFRETLKSECISIDHSFCPGVFPKDFNEQVLALDTETTGLDVRCRYGYSGNLIVNTKIVGFSVAVSENEGWYLPILHNSRDGVLNWDYELIMYFLGMLHQEFFLIYHNAQYDREVMALNGVCGLRKWPYFCDTQILDFFNNVNIKSHGLKVVSERLLGRKMIEIEQLFGFGKKKKGMNLNFNRIPAKAGYVYAVSDSINTYGLFKYYVSRDREDNMFLTSPVPLTIDHKSVDVLRNISRGGVPVDLDFYMWAAKDIEYRIMLLEQRIFEYVGRRFDINSPDQISDLLFIQYNIPVLPGEELNKKGKYSTKADILDKLFEKYSDYPILKYIVRYRKITDVQVKTYLKIILNFYIDALVPWTRIHAQYSQTVIPTGRFSSSSNKGRDRVVVKKTPAGNITSNYYSGSGDAGINVQGIPNPHYILKKAKRIKKIPESAGVDVNKVYPKEVMERLIKRLVAI